jgi:hypothetical protein
MLAAIHRYAFAIACAVLGLSGCDIDESEIGLVIAGSRPARGIGPGSPGRLP